MQGGENAGTGRNAEEARRSARLRRIILSSSDEGGIEGIIPEAEDEGEALARRMMEQSGNSVDFMA